MTDNNYTKGGELAIGRNLNVAYAAYRGYNHEDGIVISEGAAKALTSHHAYKFDYDKTEDSVTNKNMVTRYFGHRLSKEILDKLDDHGFAKPGVTLRKDDVVYAVLERRTPSPEERMLGKLHKTLVNPYRLVAEYWEDTEPAKVVDAHTEGRNVRILVRTIKELEVGDKLTG